jgi:hypothetical protein
LEAAAEAEESIASPKKTQSSVIRCISGGSCSPDEEAEEDACRVDWLEPSEFSMISLMSFL